MTVPPIPFAGWTGRASGRAPAEPGPARDVVGAVLGLGQLAALVCLAAGVVLLAGVAWALVVLGAVLFPLLLVADYTRSRPPVGATTPNATGASSGGDR